MAQKTSAAAQAAPFTKRVLLEVLRALRDQLLSPEVEAKVKKLSFAKRQEFVATRLLLTNAINTLNKCLMKDIRQKLEQQSPKLHEGIGSLAKSLGKLERATKWAAAINGIVALLGKVVPLL